MKLHFKADNAEQLKTLIAGYIAQRAEKEASTTARTTTEKRVKDCLARELADLATMLHASVIEPVETAPTIAIWLNK